MFLERMTARVLNVRRQLLRLGSSAGVAQERRIRVERIRDVMMVSSDTRLAVALEI